MIDFVGRSGSVSDAAQKWGQIFGEADAHAQSRWQNREARSRYDETNRYNRDGALSDAEFMQQNAGLFSNEDASLAGLGVTGTPLATNPNEVPTNTTAQPTRGTKPIGNRLNTGMHLEAEAQTLRNLAPINPSNLTPEQRVAWSRYITTTRSFLGGNNRIRSDRVTPSGAEQAARRILHSVGLDVRDGVLMGPAAQASNNKYNGPSAVVELPPGGTTPSEEDNSSGGGLETQPPEMDFGPNLTTNPGGLEPPDAPEGSWEQSLGDTSRSMQATREMRLTELAVRDSLRRADVAARHGDRAGAQQAFAQALQGQAAYLQQYHTSLYRAASAGNLDATATLIEQLHGYPHGTVRVQSTNEARTRFMLQIKNSNGEWVAASEQPVTRNEMLGGLLNLVDAAGAAARTEANTELLRAQIAANASITVANIEQRNVIIRAITDAQIAHMNNTARAQLQNGQGQLLLDPESGGAWFRYSDVDEQGNIVNGVEFLQMQDLPTASTQGNQTTRAPTRTRVTGVPGVGARQ